MTTLRDPDVERTLSLRADASISVPDRNEFKAGDFDQTSSTAIGELELSWKNKKRLLSLRRNLWTFCSASVLAAFVVGSFYRHTYPEPELLPAESSPAPPFEAPKFPENQALRGATDSASPGSEGLSSRKIGEVLEIQSADLRKISLACKIALNARQFRLDSMEPFPACVPLLTKNPCGRISLQYLETKYLLAYANYTHQKSRSLHWLRSIQGPVSRCRSVAPELAKRALQFFEKAQRS